MRGDRPRARPIALALAAALIAVLVVALWPPSDSAPAERRPARAPTPAVSARGSGGSQVSMPPPWLSVLHTPRQPPAPPPPAQKPRIVDLATITPSSPPAEDPDTERFRTTDSFTAEDLQHPELYFAMAEQMPELNRPEERRDTLAFFRAYRDQLSRDLESAGTDAGKRAEIVTVIDRYDRAIATLQNRIEAESAQPKP